MSDVTVERVAQALNNALVALVNQDGRDEVPVMAVVNACGVIIAGYVNAVPVEADRKEIITGFLVYLRDVMDRYSVPDNTLMN